MNRFEEAISINHAWKLSMFVVTWSNHLVEALKLMGWAMACSGLRLPKTGFNKSILVSQHGFANVMSATHAEDGHNELRMPCSAWASAQPIASFRPCASGKHCSISKSQWWCSIQWCHKEMLCLLSHLASDSTHHCSIVVNVPLMLHSTTYMCRMPHCVHAHRPYPA